MWLDRNVDPETVQDYPETEMCMKCKGECCRLQPGHCLPSEFGSANAVREAVESGKYTIVLLLDSHIMARVVRPHYKEPDRRTGCIFHRASGCELSLSARPHGCRMLRPTRAGRGALRTKGDLHRGGGEDVGAKRVSTTHMDLPIRLMQVVRGAPKCS